MSTSTTYASYLVRLWRQPVAESDGAVEWQGEVEHIQSGQQWRFECLPDLLTLLRVQADEPDKDVRMLHG